MPLNDENNKLILTALFERVDENNDGALSLAEFRSMRKLTGLSKTNLTRLFVALDTDGDEEITCEEFIEEMMVFYNDIMNNAKYTSVDLQNWGDEAEGDEASDVASTDEEKPPSPTTKGEAATTSASSCKTASKTDVAASKAKTRGALLAGLRNGNLEAAVAKMEDDVAAEESIGTK